MSLTAYVRYDHNGRIVPGGPVVTKNKPAVGNWQVVAEGTNVTLVGQLRAFVKLDRYNKPLAGSLFLGKSKPATGKWLEVNATYEGATAPTTTTTTSSSTSTTTSTTTQNIVYADYEASRFTQFLCPPQTGVTLNIGVPGGDIATASIIYCNFAPNFTSNDTLHIKFNVSGTYYTRRFITNNDATSATPTGSPVAC
jgi:hypothetical protein